MERIRHLNKIYKTLRTLSFNLCKRLVYLLLSKPHLLFNTVWATIEATILAENNFPDSHLGHGKANAFKHAAWNALIAYHTQWYYKTAEQSIAWAQKITDLHEACFPNAQHEMQMDLANNLIGRQLYQKLFLENNSKPNKEVLLETLKKQQLISLE